MIDLCPLLIGEERPGRTVHPAKSLEIGVTRLALVQARLVDHQEVAGRSVDGLEEIALPVRREMMDREAAPGGVRFLGPPGERGDEVAVVELDLERNAGEVLRGKLKRRLRQIDAVIVRDLGADERLPHLVGIAAGNVEKGEGLGDGGERPMQDRSHFLMSERIAIDQLLIGRPLLLKLLERGAVGHRAFGMEVMNVDVHACNLNAKFRQICARRDVSITLR